MEQKIEPLNTKIIKAVVNGSVYDILSVNEYNKMKISKASMYNVAVKYNTDNGKELVLPARGNYSSNVTVPGIYSSGPLNFYVIPNETNINQYQPKKIVEINNTDSMKDILSKEETINRLAEPWITTPDNISTFTISENDQPEMIALKTALNKKHIDFDKYAGRFGANFPNDKRQLKNNTATLNIIKRFCDNLDLDCEIILKDKHPGVANPMGEEVRISLTNVSE